MAASQALIGYSSTLEVEDGTPGTFTKIAEIKSVSKPNPSVDEVEVTHMESPDRAKEYIAGLSDYSTIDFDLNWVPDSATDLFIEAWRASGETRQVKVTYGATGATDTFPAFVQGYEAGASSPGEALAGTLTLRIAGAVVRGSDTTLATEGVGRVRGARGRDVLTPTDEKVTA
jgi:predicted secreted protein